MAPGGSQAAWSSALNPGDEGTQAGVGRLGKRVQEEEDIAPLRRGRRGQGCLGTGGRLPGLGYWDTLPWMVGVSVPGMAPPATLETREI